MNINPVTAQTTGGAATQTAQPPASSDVTKDEFLKLLVAQLKNQDPANPADGTQFLSQLAQFSQLEQTMAMRSDLDTLTASTAAAQTNTTPGAAASAGA